MTSNVLTIAPIQGRDVDLLFGLDMLKRHQACIDLEKNVLRIQGREVPFLAEHELPEKARHTEELAQEVDRASATGNLPLGPKEPQDRAQPSTSSTSTFTGSGHKLGSPSSSQAPGRDSSQTAAAPSAAGDNKALEPKISTVSLFAPFLDMYMSEWC